MYPSQVVRLKAKSPGYQPRSNLMQIAFSMLHVKNGTQQTRKTPENRINYLIMYFLVIKYCLLAFQQYYVCGISFICFIGIKLSVSYSPHAFKKNEKWNAEFSTIRTIFFFKMNWLVKIFGNRFLCFREDTWWATHKTGTQANQSYKYLKVIKQYFSLYIS